MDELKIELKISEVNNYKKRTLFNNANDINIDIPSARDPFLNI